MLTHPQFAGLVFFDWGRLHRLQSVPHLKGHYAIPHRIRTSRPERPRPRIESDGDDRNAGLTEPVLKEIAASLRIHELIKIRVMAERPQREAILTEICTQLNAAPVQHIGKILVVYQPNPDAHKIEINKMPRHKGKKPLTKKQLGSRS